jgi:hypothetical protein
MRTTIKLAALFIFFLIADSAFAQYGYGYPYDYGYGSAPGMDRSIGRVPNAPKGKDKDKKEVDFVEVTVKYLDKKLNLDDFQEAAITTVYNDHKADVLIIAGTDEPVAVKKDKMRTITEIIDAKIMKYLSEEQIEAYKKLIEERKE